GAGARPPGLPFPLSEDAFWESFPRELADSLIADYLAIVAPNLYAPLILSGVIDERRVPAGAAGRLSYRRVTLRWDRLGDLLTAPQSLMRDVYGWGTAF